ncbi:MAG: OmpA family protein [Bacteroidaceae bacterium]|nr:OmpA family protein [Bacteroidaceae bacterium]
MKKLFTLCCALVLGAVAANAQVTVKGSKLTDNISVGLAGGVVTPSAHHAFFSDMRPVANLTLAKQITPILGLAVEGETGFNTTHLTGVHSKTTFDVLNVNLLGQVNLNNLIAGYKGTPRFLELVAVFGAGWGHDFVGGGSDHNYMASKAGLNFNFNLGEAKAWQINIKPAITWNVTDNNDWIRYNVNKSALSLLAGVTYKFKNSNGTNNFQIAKLYDQAEVDALNAKINDLRTSLNSANNAKAQAEANVKDLQRQLNDCRNKAPEVVKVTEKSSTNNLESVVTFAQGKSVVAASQYPNVERIATYLKNHANSKVVIKGYASPEGSAEINAKLAKARAEAVKSLLIKKYRISSSRIEAEGQGVGNMFSEPDWNRVAISTLSE